MRICIRIESGAFRNIVVNLYGMLLIKLENGIILRRCYYMNFSKLGYFLLFTCLFGEEERSTFDWYENELETQNHVKTLKIELSCLCICEYG